MSVEAPWVKVSQQGWEDRALDLAQPLWLKVSCMAYARVGANGHAGFKPGELARMLGGKHRQEIDRAVRTAIAYGWLDETSCSECLIPPGDFVEISLGSSRKECVIHPSGGPAIEWIATEGKKDQKRADELPQVSAIC